MSPRLNESNRYEDLFLNSSSLGNKNISLLPNPQKVKYFNNLTVRESSFTS